MCLIQQIRHPSGELELWRQALSLVDLADFTSYFFISSWPQVIIAIFFLGREDKYYEPEYWKFGEDGNKYFRHATGQLYAISKDLAAYISINSWVPYPKASVFPHLLPSSQSNIAILKYFGRPILHRYANEDVSLGSWLLGLEVEHVDERSMCCGTPPGTQINHTTILTVLIFSSSQSATSFTSESITYLKINWKIKNGFISIFLISNFLARIGKGRLLNPLKCSYFIYIYLLSWKTL